MINEPDKYTFNDIVKAAEKYFSENPNFKEGVKAESGEDDFEGEYYHFKRWEWNNAARVSPEGKIFNYAAKTYQELESHKNLSNSENRTLATANWQFVGPSSYALKNGWNGGVGRVNCIAFHPTNANTIWVGTPGGGLWKTVDNGISWVPLTDNLIANLGVSSIAIDPTNTDIIYIVTGDGETSSGIPSIGVFKTTNGGATWNSTGLIWSETQRVKARKIVIHPTQPAKLLLVTSKGIYKSSDAGLTWVLKKTGNFFDIEFKPGSPSILYACNQKDFFKSLDGGETWSIKTNGLPSTANSLRLAIAITPINPLEVYLVVGGPKGVDPDDNFIGMYKSSNSGNSFLLQSTGPNILGYEQNGTDDESQASYDIAILASNITANLVAVGGINVWCSTDAGLSWGTSKTYWEENSAPAGQYVHADIHALEINPHNNNWVAGTDGGIYFSTNNGNSWSGITSSLGIQQIYRVSEKDGNAGGMFVGTQDNGCNGFSGSVAQHVRGGDGMEVHAVNGVVYAANNNGSDIYRYTGNPITGPNNWINIQPQNGDGKWIIPFELHPKNSSTLYAAYDKIWESNNQGTNWNLLSGSTLAGGSKYVALAISPSNPERIYAATDNGIIYRRDVAGSTWTNVTSPDWPSSTSALITDICISSLPSTNGLTAWVTFSGYVSGKKVYKTTNGGTSWTNVSTGLPNLPVNCIQFDSVYGSAHNAIYIGTDLGVYYRNDEMGTWTTFTTGLPNVRVNDLEIVPTENMIYAGTYGRGLWKSDLSKTCVSAKITISNGSSELCPGGSVILKANPSGATTYLWSNGATTETIVVSTSGSYLISVTSAGCSASISPAQNISIYGVGGAIQWQNTIGGIDYENLYSIQQTIDGGYILGGKSDSNISGDKTETSFGNDDYWIVKINATGNIQWQNTIGGSETEELISIQQTSDGGYILGGLSDSNISGDKSENNIGDFDYWIVKTNAAGNIQWQNTIGGSNFDALTSIQQTNDGGFILGGISYSDISGDKTENSNGDLDYWIVKTDSLGNIQWQNTIGGDFSDDLSSVQQTSDGGYILGGSSGSDISGDKTENRIGSEDYWIVKTNASGNIVWQNTIGGSDPEQLNSIQQTSDGGYILGGLSISDISGDKTENSFGNGDYWIVKTNASGIIQWQNTIGGSGGDILHSIYQTIDGGYVLGGSSDSNISGDKTENGFGNDDYWIVKTNASGNIQWQNIIGGSAFDELYSIQQTSDGGYILGGYSNSNISGNKTENSIGETDYWIVKMSDKGICPVPFLGLSAANLTTSAAKLNWDIIPCAEGYQTQYRVKGTTTWTTVKVNTNTGFKNIVGLTPSTIYEWRVRSRCDIANNINSAYTPIMTFTTASLREALIESKKYRVNIYPNPSSSHFNLDISLDISSSLSIQIYSSFGERVATIAEKVKTEGEQHFEFDASMLSSGIYFCRISTDTKTDFYKIMVVK